MTPHFPTPREYTHLVVSLCEPGISLQIVPRMVWTLAGSGAAKIYRTKNTILDSILFLLPQLLFFKVERKERRCLREIYVKYAEPSQYSPKRPPIRKQMA